MKIKSLMLVLLVLSCNLAFSQSFYQEGYYIELSNDTVKGYIKIVSGSKIKFKLEKESKRIKLKPNMIKGFSVNGDNYKVIRNFEAKSVNSLLSTNYDDGFAREIVTGDINLLGYTITTNNGQIYEKREYFFLQKGDKGHIIQAQHGKRKFREQMKLFLSDKPEVFNHFNVDKIRYVDLRSIIETYNSL